MRGLDVGCLAWSGGDRPLAGPRELRRLAFPKTAMRASFKLHAPGTILFSDMAFFFAGRRSGDERFASPRPRSTLVARAGTAGTTHGFALALIAGAILIWLGVLAFALRAAALAPEAAGTMLAIFPPGISEEEAFASLLEAGGRPIRRALGSFAWIVDGEGEGFAGRLEAQGALAAFRDGPAGIPLAGCFFFADSEPAPPLVPLPR